MAERLGMKVKSVRLFFIYASFATLVGGFVIYLTLAHEIAHQLGYAASFQANAPLTSIFV